MSFGRLRERLWNNHNVSIRVKGKIYRAIILATLLYGAETWTVYRRHVTKLHALMMRHMRSIMTIRWQNKVTKHTSSQAARIPFYGSPPHQEESPPSETGFLLAATRRTSTTWPPTSPLQRHYQGKSKEKGY